MKTSCKRIVSFILVLMTIVGCCVPALAADTNCKHDNPEHQTFIKEIEATCKTDGYKQYRCEDCNTVYLDEDSITPATGKHNYAKVEVISDCIGTWEDVNQSGTADEGDRYKIGAAHYACTVCGDKKLQADGTTPISEPIYRKYGEAAKHSWVYTKKSGSTKAAFDCTEGGTRKCSVCKISETLVAITSGKLSDHYGYATRPDGHNGTQEYCTACGVEETVKHVFKSTVKENPHDCKAGVMLFECECGKSYEAVIPAEKSEHKDDDNNSYLVDKADQAATCTTAGWSYRQDCSNCGAQKVGTTIKISAYGHFDTDGKTYDLSKFGDYKAYKAAECTKAGNYEQKKCLRCDLIISEKDGKWVEGAHGIPALGHNIVFVSWVTAADCYTGKDGVAKVKCGRTGCTASIANQNVSSTHDWAHENHVLADGSINNGYYTESSQPASCAQYGINVKTCVYCLHDKTEIVDRKAHSWKDVGVQNADCVNPGISANTRQCKNCQMYENADAVTPALGHIKSTVFKGVDATCTASGYYYCERGEKCPSVYNGTQGCVEVGMLNHSWVATTKVINAATCNKVAEFGYECTRNSQCKSGLKSGSDTEVNKAILSGTAFDPNNHETWSTATNPATCITTGTVTKTCPNCKKVETAVLDLIDGIPSTVITGAKVTYAALIDAYAAANNITSAADKAKIDVTSYSVIDYMVKNNISGYTIDATCTVKGSTTWICDLMYNEKYHTHVTVGEYSHTDTTGAYTDTDKYTITDLVPPTCTRDGMTRIVKCKETNCKATLVEGVKIPAIHTAISSIKFDNAAAGNVTIYFSAKNKAWTTDASKSDCNVSATFTYDAGVTAVCHNITTGASTEGRYANLRCDECYVAEDKSAGQREVKVTFVRNNSTKKYVQTASLAYTKSWSWASLSAAAHCSAYNCKTCYNNQKVILQDAAAAQNFVIGTWCDGTGYKNIRVCTGCKEMDININKKDAATNPNGGDNGLGAKDAKILTGVTPYDSTTGGVQTASHLGAKEYGAVEWTCYQAEVTAGVKCPTCGILKAAQAVDKDGDGKVDSKDYKDHDPDGDPDGDGVPGATVVRTCTTPGFEYTCCSMCLAATSKIATPDVLNKVHTVIDETTYVAPDGHKNAKGYLLVEGWYCSDERLTQKISDSEKKNGYHDWNLETDFVCVVCKLGEDKTKTNPLLPAHETVTKGESKPATCVKDGYTISICDFCKTDETEIHPKNPNAHVYGEAKEVEASYTESAKIVKVCELCGNVAIVKELGAKKTAFEVRLEVFNPYSDDMKFVKSGIIGVRVILVTKDGGEFDITAAQVTFPVSENLIYRDVKYGEAFTTDNSLITANIKANTMVGTDDCIFLMNMLNDADGNVITTTVSGEFTLGEVYFVISDGLREIPKGGQFDVDLSVGDDMVVIDVPTIDGKSTIVLDDNYDATTKTYGSYGVNTEVSKMDAIDVGYLGDANGDNVVNGQDSQRLAALIRRNGYEAALDINKDSVCNTTDLTLLQANIVGALSDMNFCNQGLSEDEAWLIKK